MHIYLQSIAIAIEADGTQPSEGAWDNSDVVDLRVVESLWWHEDQIQEIAGSGKRACDDYRRRHTESIG